MSFPGTETVREEKFCYEIHNGGHSLRADVLAELGGEDKGMNPHALLEAALAACTAITMQMYADRHQFDLQSADVHVKIMSEGPETQIQRVIEMTGDLTPEQRQRLLEIATKCPIHKLLTSKISIVTQSA